MINFKLRSRSEKLHSFGWVGSLDTCASNLDVAKDMVTTCTDGRYHMEFRTVPFLNLACRGFNFTEVMVPILKII